MQLEAMEQQAAAEQGPRSARNAPTRQVAGGRNMGVEPTNPAQGGGAPIETMGEEATFEGATGETRGFAGGG
jgi:hypothetical protein